MVEVLASGPMDSESPESGFHKIYADIGVDSKTNLTVFSLVLVLARF